MKNKQIVLFAFSLFVLVLFFNNISANSCIVVDTVGDCTGTGGVANGKVVMYLSDSTNAHGELRTLPLSYVSHPYSKVLCCNFGGTSAEPSACSTTDFYTSTNEPINKIIGLSSPSNAHAEEPINNNYQSDVCYDSLYDCFITNSSYIPGLDEVEVLDLSSDTNAHLSAAESTITSYTNNKIYCYFSTTPPPAACTAANEATTCTTGYKCDTTAGICKTSCATTTGDCQTNYVCTNGQCVSSPTCASLSCSGTTPICTGGATPQCVACSTSNPCPGGQTCNTDGSCSVPSGACALTDAYWSLDGGYTVLDENNYQVYGSDPVTLVVVGSSRCVGKDVTFDGSEDDSAGDDSVVMQPDSTTLFVSSGSESILLGTWNAEWVTDLMPPYHEYYFIATLTDGSTTSINSQDIGSTLLKVKDPAMRTCEPRSLVSCNSLNTINTCGGSETIPSSCVDFSSITTPFDCSQSTIVCGCAWGGSSCNLVQLGTTPPSSTDTFCGDGIIQSRENEDCDPGTPPPGTSPDEDLGGIQCTDLDSYTGVKAGETFGCRADNCQFNDAVACEGGTATCGDGVRTHSEICDTNDFPLECSDLRGDGGSLSCINSCTGIDASGCTVAECTIDDNCKVNGQNVGDRCVSGRCVKADGNCSGTDTSLCTPTTRSYVCIRDICVDTGSVSDPVETCSVDIDCDAGEICVEGFCVTKSDSIGVDLTYCGDNIIQSDGNSLGNFEECDGTNLGTGITATNGCSLVSSGFYTGTGLECAYNCQYNYRSCTVDPTHATDPLCGNGILDDQLTEECDTTDFGMFGNACASGIGTMTCDADCKLNTASCTVPPGDGLGTPIGKCTISTTGDDTCADDNFLTYTWSGVWKDLTTDTIITTCDLSDEKCIKCTAGGTSTIACPAQVALPFFNIYNFIITSIAIALIYGAIILKRKGIIKIVD